MEILIPLSGPIPSLAASRRAKILRKKDEDTDYEEDGIIDDIDVPDNDSL